MPAGKRYPEAQRLVILADALVTSAPEAAARWGVPDHVVWSWAAKFGGLRALREVYESKQVGAIAEMAGAITIEVRKRLPHMAVEHVLELALEALKMNKQIGGGNTTILAPFAQAQAKQEIPDVGNRLAEVLQVLADSGALTALLGGRGSNGAKDDDVLPAPSDP